MWICIYVSIYLILSYPILSYPILSIYLSIYIYVQYSKVRSSSIYIEMSRSITRRGVNRQVWKPWGCWRWTGGPWGGLASMEKNRSGCWASEFLFLCWFAMKFFDLQWDSGFLLGYSNGCKKMIEGSHAKVWQADVFQKLMYTDWVVHLNTES